MKGEAYQNQKQLQFQFDLQIQKIKLLNSISIPKSSYLQVIWRRGQKNISTKIKPQIKGTQQQIFFGETLSMISTCALNSDTLQFGLKQSIVSAVIYISGSQKLFGSVTINLSSVINPKNYYERGVRLIEEQLNGRAKSKIFMKLSCNYLKQKMKGDDQSIGSGIHSQSYNNTSTYSIERRLVDIPSKDTYSVMSYGGAPRYSNRKQDTASIRRQDSIKKMQQQSSKQYGRYGYTQQNFYTKPTNEYNLIQNTNQAGQTGQIGVIQGITAQGSSNIKSISSIQSSANRIQRNSQSENNRSALGQQSSRLLIQQQTKRSKLEAEVTKNKVENEELKNKLTQYVRQNMKMKEQLRKFYENNDSKHAQTKKQNDELKQRNYVLTNQVKQLKNKFQRYIGLEKQCQNLRIQKQNYQKDSKRHQDVSNHFQRQAEELRSQIHRIKQNESRLINQMKEFKTSKLEVQETKKRQLENKIKQLNGQLEYYQNSCKNLSVMLREAEQKARNSERQAKNHQSRIQMVKSDQNRKFNDFMHNKEKEIRELNEKLNLKNQQCTKYIVEAQKFKNQYGKIKDQRIAELENNRVKQSSQIDRLSINLKQALNRADQLQNQKNALNAQIRGQLVLRSKQSEKAKQAQQSLQQMQKKYQKQNSQLRRNFQQLQMQNLQLNKVLADKMRMAQQASSSRQQLQHLMKQNLQLQLQIKYKNEQSMKYMRLQQDLQNVKCKLTIQEGNNRQLTQSYEKCQKELKDKNRAYILECEKSKMLIEERMNLNRSYNQLKQQLDRAKLIMENGERQFQDMKQCIQDLENRNISLVQQIKGLQLKITNNNTDKYTNQIKNLESRIRQMESRDVQKIKSIETLHRSLANSTKQIKQLQMLSEQRYQQVSSKQRSIAELQQKIKDLESNRNHMQSQIQTANQDRKNLSKKNQMIMEELFSYKKRFEEERGRSTSTLQIRSSEDYIKIKNLQNELQKKEDKIRKMQKQMINLQNQNVNLSIQVMKKLQDITPK